ncbi:MAG: N-6 DNA methylase [Acetobacteraceae bacterium]|nr:N-6 DNA methylase [Acetobacteraceae bacterium]
MLIQHILTEDIFARVFGENDFHRENNIANALYELEQLFFRGSVKQQTLRALDPYYAAIRSIAALIESHSEKQGFLKALYENFYKTYTEKAADRLGVVYTPNELVRFMVASADWLCEKHFKKTLVDKGVEILDPATGTGNFIVELPAASASLPGTPRRAGPPYGRPAQASQGGPFWTPIRDPNSTPIDSRNAVRPKRRLQALKHEADGERNECAGAEPADCLSDQ